jgi:hypothetical protein
MSLQKEPALENDESPSSSTQDGGLLAVDNNNKYPGFLEALQSSSLSLKDELTQGKTYFVIFFFQFFFLFRNL